MSRQPTDETEEDFLTEDNEIANQKIVLLSFLSPEKILENKDVYFFKNFLNNYALQWRTTKLEAWLAGQVSALNTKIEDLAGKLEKPGTDASGVTVLPTAAVTAAASELRQNLLRVDNLVEEFQQYTRKNMSELTTHTLKEEYETFLFNNGQKLEDEFFKANNFRTTIRGLKVRGVFSTQEEASAKAKRLQKLDPTFNIYMGHVGKWMAWEPDPNKVGDQEYANEELNTLMKKYRENEDNREVFYNEQKRTRMGAAKTKAAGGTEAAAVSLTASAETETETEAPTEDKPASSYDGLFSGPADLALARKLEKK